VREHEGIFATTSLALDKNEGRVIEMRGKRIIRPNVLLTSEEKDTGEGTLKA